MKKTLLSLAAVVLTVILLSLASCAPLLEESDARAIAERLLTDSVEVNEIYFGKGLPYDADAYDAKMQEIEAQLSLPGGDRVVYPIYLPLAEDAKYQTADEIRAAARRVYSANYCEYMYTLAFTGIGSDDDFASLAKYCPSIDDESVLTVRVLSPDDSEIMPEVRTFDLSSITFTKIARGYMIFTVKTMLGGEPDVTITVTAVREKLPEELSYSWYLDTPTY